MSNDPCAEFLAYLDTLRNRPGLGELVHRLAGSVRKLRSLT